jgi:transcription initiation factor TFIIH subunit 1
MYENILVFLLPGQNTSNEEADINANQDRLSRILKMMEIDDLQASIDLPLAPLSIKV